MNDWKLKKGERLDDLVRDGMKIIQRPDQFCFSLDSVLLAHYVRLRKKDRVLELGTGTGVISLLLSAFGASDITALEINPVMAELAARNVAGNHKEKVISVLQCDYTRLKEGFPAGGFTSVVVNPPYRPVGNGRVNRIPDVASACHELSSGLEDVFRAAGHVLSTGGRLTMVHRADRAVDIFCEARARQMEPKRIRFVHSSASAPAGRVLIEMRVGGHPGLIVDPPLIVHEENGEYTKEILAIYGKEDL